MRITAVRLVLLIAITLCGFQTTYSQTTDSSAAQQRAQMMKKMESRYIYPAVKGSPATGVIPVTDATEPIDPKLHYKLLFDCTQGNNAQYKNGKVNEGIEEIGRIINLHKGAGVADKNLSVTIVVHSIAVLSFLNDEAYSKKFGTPNPNADLIRQLQKMGAHIVVCGQTMQYRELENKDLMEGIFKSFSARTALSTYLSKGYVPFPIAEPH